MAKCNLPVSPWATGKFLSDVEDLPFGQIKIHSLRRNNKKGTATCRIEHESARGKYILIDATLLGKVEGNSFICPDQVSGSIIGGELILSAPATTF